MKKLKMARGVTLTFEEGCNKYLEIKLLLNELGIELGSFLLF